MTTMSDEDLRRELLELDVRIRTLQVEQLRSAAVPAEPETPVPPSSTIGRAGTKRAGVAIGAADLAGTASELGRLRGGAVTLPQGVLRQAEITEAALAGAADAVAADIAAVVPEGATLVVTDRTDLVPAALAAEALLATMVALREAGEVALARHRDVTGTVIERTEPELDGAAPAEEAPPGAGPPAGEETPSGAAQPSVPTSVPAALAALAVTATNLLAVDTEVATAAGSATALRTQVAVMQRLAGRTVRHDGFGVPRADGAVLAEHARLHEVATELEAVAAADAAELELLQQETAKRRTQTARAVIARLTRTVARTTTLATSIRALETALDTPAADGTSPLVAAARVQDLTSAAGYVAVVLPARLDAHQVAQRRRVAASTVMVTASATIDTVVVALPGGEVVRAASRTASRAFQVRFPVWWWPWSRVSERPPDRGLPQHAALPAWPLVPETTTASGALDRTRG